jgi:1-aminocyclopropane-1-carboxylate deaminase/D-cysteine desulfhydrase-like pyridoxal-dependent ACC family enzyme
MNPAPLTVEELRRAAARLPRLELAHLPTPLEEVPRFAAQLGGPRLFLKRDDCTGLLFGGNKTRHNEFLLAEALQRKADVVVWGAGVQSNNCRQTAAACARLGLDCHLYLSRAAHNDDIQGNLLLDHLVGAQVTIIDEPLGPGLDDVLLARAEELRRQGRRPYAWDRHTGRPLAAVSYALALAEIVEQMARRGVTPTAIYVSAAGATGAGLLLGQVVLGLRWAVRLICPIRWPWKTQDDMAEVANQAAVLLGLPHRVRPADVEVSEEFIGAGYGQMTPEGWEAMRLLARTEGVLLDPVYTAKAMAGLMADVRLGHLGRDNVAVFIHTGGLPAVFAYRDELLEALHRNGEPKSFKK